MFDPVDPKQSFPALERGILQYWKEEDLFRRSVELRQDGEVFSFYDGPPFATGLPHYGHLLGGTIKDVIPRYQTMRGKRVERRFGWDCHGLPVEYEVEKERGINAKTDVETIGIKAFNDACRGIVQRFAAEWRTTVERMGRWVDMDLDYKTMDPAYMESIWWVFSKLHEKNLIYEGYKPMHVCPRCVTPLSNFEVTQGYKEVTDRSAIAMFRMKDEEDGEDSEEKTGRHSRSSQLAANSSPVSFLAWTTTPWTLPGNVFLAVHPAVTYALVAQEGNTYIVAEELVARVFGERPHEVTGTVRGKELIGKRYEPLFPYFAEQYATTGFRVVAGEFVTTEDGTGIVHIAPGFGEDDFAIGAREGVPLLQHVTMDGRFTAAVADFAGQEVKPKDDPTKTDQKIAAWLEERGLLFESASYRHTYPHCWRCDSPLLNYATSSWFVAVERLKDDLLQVNKETAWVPAHVRDGRFGKWLENARDWAISRNRYWGTPLPVWRSDETGETTVIRSRDEVMARAQIRFTKVSAIRHGQSENNVAQVYEGTEPGSGLTTLGKTQADEAGKRLAAERLDVIYCSPLLRARETAERIAKQTGARIVVDDRIRETDMGDYEGTNYDFHDLAFVKARRAQELAKDAPGSIYDLPGMETPDAIFDRISAFLQDILPRHRSEHIAIVSHGSPLTHIRRFFTGDDYAKLAAQRMQRNCAIQTFFWDHDHGAQMDLHKDVIDSIVWPAQEGDAVSEVTLVRHGETDWNKNRIMQGGQGDPPLNETGRLQAAELAASLHGKRFDAIVCSPQRRCQETAEILARELGLPITETLVSLRERECGDWTGTDEAEFLAAHPTLHGSPSVTMHHMSFRDGESLSQFLQRVTQSHEYLLQHYAGKKVLVVTHGGVIRAWHAFLENLSYRDAVLQDRTPNCALFTFGLKPLVRRIPDVLDCWFESGSMPYALPHYPFEAASYASGATSTRNASHTAELSTGSSDLPLPVGFPADFIAEGIDQTRGWFYTLTVLSTALFNRPAFRNVIVNGIVLAEDGRKMSKRLKNYPDPGALMEQYGADALRFTLMHSPAVRAEDLRFSEKAVEETLRSVLLPLWNSYSFFVTYANAAGFEPAPLGRTSPHPLDRWIRAEVQDLLNRITQQLDRYELSAACGEIFSTVDALTNWYIRLSRRRFAGKGGGEGAEAMAANFEEDRHNALSTLYDVLLTLQQILAPFCPFLADAVYLNLAGEEHGSIHLTDWPATRALTPEETALLHRNRLLRTVVSLGLKIRSEQKVKVRTPLSRLTVAVPENLKDEAGLDDDDLHLLRQELNVKEVILTDDPGALGERIALVDARKAGPRLGKRVQEIIAAGKAGAFSVEDDGSVRILEETLGPEEVSISYRGADGVNVASDRGIVVSIDTAVTPELHAEGQVRDLIRAIQKLRKEEGLAHTDRIALTLEGCDDLLAAHGSLLLQETNAILQDNDGPARPVELEDGTVRIRFTKHGATSTS